MPALQLSRSDHGDALKDGGSRRQRRARRAHRGSALVVAEVALSLVLLAGAGLLVRSFVALQRVEPGFVPERAVTMQLLLPGRATPTRPTQIALLPAVCTTAAALPGVQSAAVSTTLPLRGSNLGAGFTVDGQPLADPADAHRRPRFAVSAPSISRRWAFRSSAAAASPARRRAGAAAWHIINETMAGEFWPGEDPIGKRLTIELQRDRAREIVGVVARRQAAAISPTRRRRRCTRRSCRCRGRSWRRWSGRRGDPDALPARCARRLRGVDPDLRGRRRPDDRRLSRAVDRDAALHGVLLAGFAALALLLAGCRPLRRDGLLGGAAQPRDRHPHGARRAGPATSARMVVVQALRMGAAGLASAWPARSLATRLLDSLLFGVSAADPPTFAAVSRLLLAVLLVAAYLPARRATRVDPMVALRTE